MGDLREVAKRRCCRNIQVDALLDDWHESNPFCQMIADYISLQRSRRVICLHSPYPYSTGKPVISSTDICHMQRIIFIPTCFVFSIDARIFVEKAAPICLFRCVKVEGNKWCESLQQSDTCINGCGDKFYGFMILRILCCLLAWDLLTVQYYADN